jgi:hypothetical protein
MVASEWNLHYINTCVASSHQSDEYEVFVEDIGNACKNCSKNFIWQLQLRLGK